MKFYKHNNVNVSKVQPDGGVYFIIAQFYTKDEYYYDYGYVKKKRLPTIFGRVETFKEAVAALKAIKAEAAKLGTAPKTRPKPRKPPKNSNSNRNAIHHKLDSQPVSQVG